MVLRLYWRPYNLFFPLLMQNFDLPPRCDPVAGRDHFLWSESEIMGLTGPHSRSRQLKVCSAGQETVSVNLISQQPNTSDPVL